jgi:ribosomal protein S18 acetylase RimI-like enzyme
MEHQIREATNGDLTQIAEIHGLAFPHSFLTRMGDVFLRRYYRSVLEYRGGILMVGGEPGMFQGFVAGFIHPEDFYKGLGRHSLRFALPTIYAMVRHPTLVGRVMYNARRIGTAGSRRPSMGCELASIGVRPATAGKGIGKGLVRAFIEQAWSRGAQYVYLTTDAERNQSANEFYHRLGFQLRHKFEQFRGRNMNEYIIYREMAQLAHGVPEK